MADATLVFRLLANTVGYNAAMTGAAAKTSLLARAMGAAGLGQAAGLLPGKFGAITGAANKLGPGMLAVGGGLAAAALAGVKAVGVFANFDQAMSAVAASSGATGAELQSLREAAVKLGSESVFTATEAAKGIESLAKAGVQTADIVGGALKGALDLAAAGGVEVALAADTAATAMTQFGLSGAKVPHIADLLAAAAGKAQGGVEDMAMALKQSGLVASQMGLSIEDTTGTLAAFASAGLVGSDAGTSFRTMLLRLANPAGEAATLMKELGIAAYDAQGNFVGIEALAGQLQTKLGGLSQAQRDAALATIFGSDAIRGANVLYQEGAEGIADWASAVDDSGFAAQQAATRTDNLKGDVEKLGGALESLAIDQGGAANNALRELAQFATDAVGSLQELDEASRDFFDTWNSQGTGTGGPTAIGEGIISSLDTITFGLFSEALAADKATSGMKQLSGEMPKLTDKQREAEAATRANEAAIARLTGQAEAYAGVAAGAAYATGQETAALAELQQQMYDTANAQLALSGGLIGYEAAVDAAAASAEEHGKTLDITTEAGRRNQSSLDAIAAAANSVTQEMADTGAAEDAITAKSASMRAALVAAGVRFGLTEAQASAYADSVLAIPAKRNTTVTVTDQATPALQRVRAWLDGIRSKTVTITARTQIPAGVSIRQLMEQRDGGYIGGFASGGMIPGYPAGGMVYGIGGPRTDSNLIRVSRGEFVVNAADTARNRAALEIINNGGRAVPSGGGGVGGQFTGKLYLDSGALLGVIKGHIRQEARDVTRKADLYARSG